ncbi:MAG: CSLREA domain-containing protein, partial [Gammaproteobacteria bacterium]
MALVLLLLGAGTPTPAAVVEVRLEDFRFVPNDVTIQRGDTVRWSNQMGFHDVRADDGSFSRLPANEPWTFERTFTQAGEVFVHCTVHSVPGRDIDSFMNGRINVANIPVPGADITVDTLSDEINTDGDCSLREAITSANSDSLIDACAIGGGADSISFSVAGTVALTSSLPPITSAVDIIGPVGDPIIISGSGAAQLFVVGNGGLLRLDGLTLSGGLASDGGAIINNIGGTLTVFNSTFSGNRAQQSGGAIRNLGVATVVNSTFASNSAAESGGALANSGVGTMTLTNCTIAANSAALQGGGIATELQGAV